MDRRQHVDVSLQTSLASCSVAQCIATISLLVTSSVAEQLPRLVHARDTINIKPLRNKKAVPLQGNRVMPKGLFMKGRKPLSHVRQAQKCGRKRFATSHAIHETNRTCDHRKFGRKLSQNLRRRPTFRCRKYVFTIAI